MCIIISLLQSTAGPLSATFWLSALFLDRELFSLDLQLLASSSYQPFRANHLSI
jgi:hypothetical protein